MSIEAMKLAIEAWDACGRYPDATSDIERLDVAINALRAAISQQPDNTACRSVQKRLMAQQPATRHPRGCGFCDHELYAAAKCPVCGRETQPGNTARKSAPKMIATQQPATSVPDGYVPVPLQVLRDASEALGNFVSDHGWGDTDMQAMDNLDAYIARHDAKAKKGQP